MHGTRVVNVLKEGFSRPSGKCHYQKMDKTFLRLDWFSFIDLFITGDTAKIDNFESFYGGIPKLYYINVPILFDGGFS